MRDALGRKLEVGSLVALPNYRRGQAYLTVGRIESIGQGTLAVRRIGQSWSTWDQAEESRLMGGTSYEPVTGRLVQVLHPQRVVKL